MNILPIHLYKKYTEIDPSIYDFIDDNKKDVEKSLNIHNNINTLSTIYGLSGLLLNHLNINKILNTLRESILNGESPDFSELLGTIKLNYKGNLDGKENFKKLLINIIKLQTALRKKHLEYNSIDIGFEELKKDIVSNIDGLEGEKKVSTKNIINDGYFINFSFFSYLGINFHIKPIFIELINDLIHNSIKYSNTGTQIDVVINQTKEWINISISDEGFGIKEENIEKIFEYGKRLDNVGAEKGSGKGGAKLVKEIHKTGGELHVKSKIGIGTEIIFRIPNSV